MSYDTFHGIVTVVAQDLVRALHMCVANGACSDYERRHTTPVFQA